MNLFTQVCLQRPTRQRLDIYHHPGLFFWLFMLVYFGFVTVMNGIFIAMFLEARSPQLLTCRSQNKTINCDYITQGPLSGKTVQIQDVKEAIFSQKPEGDRIVLTTSQPWVALQYTNSDAQYVQQINQGLAQLRERDQTWQLEMQPLAGIAESVVVFFGSIGLLFLLSGLAILVFEGYTHIELDAKRNTVIRTRLGLLKSHLATIDQLTGADSKPLGYLGALSDKFGIYGGDEGSRNWNHKIIRLLFRHRRPITIVKTYRFNQDIEVVNAIHTFIAEVKV